MKFQQRRPCWPLSKHKSPQTVTAHLILRGADRAIEFYKRAFGATELLRVPGGAGKIVHAEIRIGDSVVMLGDENPDKGALGAESGRGETLTAVGLGRRQRELADVPPARPDKAPPEKTPESPPIPGPHGLGLHNMSYRTLR